MRVEASAKFVRLSPRKARLAARLVQGKPVEHAFNLLGFTDTATGLRRLGTAPLHSAAELVKVIKSAAANAEHNFNLDKSTLVVERIDVDGGSVLKRFRPKPRGRAGSIFKRTSHLRAWVSDEAGGVGVAPTRRVAAPKKAAPKKPAAKKPMAPKSKGTAADVVAAAEAQTAAQVIAPAKPAPKATPKTAAKPKAAPASPKKAAEKPEAKKADAKKTETKKAPAKKAEPKKDKE